MGEKILQKPSFQAASLLSQEKGEEEASNLENSPHLLLTFGPSLCFPKRESVQLLASHFLL